MAGKKGSHVGMVLSFVVFVVFLIFLYSILQPSLSRDESKEQELEYLKSQILNNISEKVSSFSVSFNKGAGQTCLRVTYPEKVKGQGAIAKDFSGNNYNSELDISDPDNPASEIDISSLGQGQGTMTILYAESFPLSSGSVLCPNSVHYDDELFLEKDEVIGPKISHLITAYSDDYQKLKEILGISESNDFSLEFEDFNGDIESTPEAQTAAEVYAEEIPIQYMNFTGGISGGFIRLRVW